ncbi:TlpA family protein disulfide reductase [Belliella marina]|uniref:TlpA family protein disulfide reductase n=1 Tax=Belliella marina TaxID=1644146 RepID=A0ABW4VQC2_9BACT
MYKKLRKYIGFCMLLGITVAPALAQGDKEKAFPFELKDTLGQVVKLEDFAGKILVMDFWFTGCKGCVQVAKALHDTIMPEFSNDSSVVFISVSLDINFLQWKRSLKSGLYTSDKQVNLFTMGMGSTHPLFKYYRYSGAPQMLLIDKEANLISSSPPMPFPGSPSIHEFISLIKKHL